MVKRCVATGYSNTYKDGISLLQFPRDPALRKQWTKEVQRTCANWQGPSDNSVLCSKHFTNDCFEEDTAIAARFGIKKRRRLKSNAVPTVFRGICHITPPKQKSLQKILILNVSEEKP